MKQFVSGWTIVLLIYNNLVHHIHLQMLSDDMVNFYEYIWECKNKLHLERNI